MADVEPPDIANVFRLRLQQIEPRVIQGRVFVAERQKASQWIDEVQSYNRGVNRPDFKPWDRTSAAPPQHPEENNTREDPDNQRSGDEQGNRLKAHRKRQQNRR